jgi:hypothetical protein
LRAGKRCGKIPATEAVLRSTGFAFRQEDSMSEIDERREDEDVEGHRRYKEEPPTEDELARRRRVAEDETSDDEPDTELHRR